MFQILGVLVLITILGILIKFVKNDPLWVAYHVGQGLQGIIVAMLVTCNCQVLKLYTKSFKCKSRSVIPSYKSAGVEANHILTKNSTLSKSSTSLQLLTWETTDPV